MIRSAAAAVRVLRTSLFVLLALCAVARPALNDIGRLHDLEHAAAAAHGHAHPLAGHHDHHGGAGHGPAPALADHGGQPHVHHHDHDHDHDPRHAGEDGQPTGIHGLLHLADSVSSAQVPAVLRLPEMRGPAVLEPSAAWVSAPLRVPSSPFRPPIALALS